MEKVEFILNTDEDSFSKKRLENFVKILENKLIPYTYRKLRNGAGPTSESSWGAPAEPSGAGMIPVMSWILLKLGISLKHQAWIEQIIFWLINLWLMTVFGAFWATVLTWSTFFLLHFLRTQNMPQAPPWGWIALIALANAIPLFFLSFLNIVILISVFFSVTAIHHILNLKVDIITGDNKGKLNRLPKLHPDGIGVNEGLLEIKDEDGTPAGEFIALNVGPGFALHQSIIFSLLRAKNIFDRYWQVDPARAKADVIVRTEDDRDFAPRARRKGYQQKLRSVEK